VLNLLSGVDLTLGLRAFAQYRRAKLACSNPVGEQEFQLLSLVRRAADTNFGRDHGFNSINSVKEFQQRVPLRYYEDMWRDYWSKPFPYIDDISWPGPTKYFAVSSGTSSGATKYLPYTQEIMDAATVAGMDLLSYHVRNRPESKIFGGKSFVLTGSTDLVENAPGIFSGDMSGICMQIMPKLIRARVFPPPGISKITSWEAMIERFALESLSADIRSLNGAPSWMLLFLDKLKKLRPESDGRICKLYPKLELLVHGGMSFAPYRKVYQELLEGSQAETREVYPASEGFMAVQDRGPGEGMRLILDHGIFYEFIPISELQSPNPTRHWIKDIETNLDYAVVLSTCAGLWGYVIGDLVRFVDKEPPRLIVTGRTSYMLSAVGEHLTGEELDECILAAAVEAGLSINEYSVGATFPKTSSDLAGHVYVVEFAQQPSPIAITQFSALLDQKLQVRNEDYMSHRRNEFGLYPPNIISVAPGFFNQWMRSRGKLGGQNKVPRVINKQEIFEDLIKFTQQSQPILSAS